VLPHAYDPSLFRDVNRRQGPLVVRYLGQFYGARTPEPLFAALLELERLRPGATADVVVEIIGSSSAESLRTPSASKLRPGLVRTVPPVDYVTSLELMRSADVLLVVDAPAAVSVFLPSKLVDYIGAGRPVVALTPPGAAASLVRRLGGWVGDPLDVVAAAEGLGAAFSAVRSGERASTRADVAGKYSVAVVGERMKQVLDEVVAAHAGAVA
jgi:hypothetical protein